MSNEQWYWEALSPKDMREVSELISTVEGADNAPIRTTWQEVESYFSEAQPWKAQGARCLSSGVLIAFGFVRADSSTGESIITISGGVHPSWRRKGIGAELLERQIDLVQVLANELGQLEYTVKMYIDERQHDLAQLVETTSFIHEYSFIQAQKVLTEGDLSEVDLIEETSKFIKINPLTSDYSHSVYLAHLEALNPKRQYDDLPDTAIEFVNFGYEPRWCFIAVDTFADRPELAGYILCSRFDFNTGNEADNEGYIEEIAVFPKWYNRGIEEALIKRVLKQFFDDGLRTAGVDLIIMPDGTEKELNQKLREAGFSPVAQTFVVGTKVQGKSGLFPQ